MSKILELKSISEIITLEDDKKVTDFYIPSYQRGYRWGQNQVEKLLVDIWNFSQSKTENEFYPLQPVVVFKDKDRYELIDGQQRITTIYIILKYLQNLFDEIEKNKSEVEKISKVFTNCFGDITSLKEKIQLPKILYETRKSSSQIFMQERISEGKDISNPDYYYMSSAYRTIKEWFSKNNVNLAIFLNTLLEDVQIIWYEVQTANEQEKRDIFARLNIGKIELTNAELIRALLLQNIENYKQQIELGNELDKIEYSLRNKQFWSFLSKTERDTKIDLVYELLADTYALDMTDDEKNKFDKNLDTKYSFYIFEYMLSSLQKSEDEIIKDIKAYFRYLEEWFLDKEFYHKIGYILNTQEKIKLLDFIHEYEKSNKQNFRNYLDDKIEKDLKNIDIDELQYGKTNSDIKKILLFFNIHTILKNENITYKFDFSKFNSRKNGDDIEHIRSQTDPDIKGNKRKDWLQTIDKYFEKIQNIKELQADDNKFENFYNKILKNLEKDDFDYKNLKDGIGNLTLLDSGINRSYGNSLFPVKRAIILDEDRKGTFLPPCTKNVFLKVYSNSIKDMMEWNKNDIDNHKQSIKDIVSLYLESKDEQ